MRGRTVKQRPLAAPPPTETPSLRESVALVSRQPIYSAVMAVTAYELLYLPSKAAPPSAATREAAIKVVADAALEIGLDRLAGGLPVHINYPRELLLAASPPSLHPERVIIEVVVEPPGDPALLDGIRALRSRGHRIALDEHSPALQDPALLGAVDIVKIDVSKRAAAELEGLARAPRARGLQLIAQQVDTVERFEQCAQLGFHGFQGDFLHRPETFRAQRVPSSRLSTLRLISALQNSEYSIEEVESLVAQDISLSYRVLRCINSSFYNLQRKVESIRQAIVILGIENLRQIAALVALQGFDNRPVSLFVTAMVRARMCEQLARLAGAKDTGPYFITGLFSLLEVLTGIPAPDLFDQLPLSRAVERALIAQEGDMGAALKCARAYERASWRRVAYGGLRTELIRAAYVDAVFWAERAQTLTAAHQ
ncbi:MAG TPA: HDOD domain-containing protein [Steroidobacteraceae bacterium]|nr:HDOD domain-containing protein [Steroidobacteraceae bacterium]